MRTIELNVYKFSELKAKAQEEVIEKWYEHEDYPFLSEDLEQELKELDTLKLFSDVKLQYSLSCCQGDGLSFSADIDKHKALTAMNYSKPSVFDALYNSIYSLKAVGNTGRYSFSHKNDIVLEYEGLNGKPILQKKLDQFQEFLQDYYLGICHKLEKYGYSILEYRMDVKEFSEHADANGYEYYADGKMA
jgi:hypothetical protein